MSSKLIDSCDSILNILLVGKQKAPIRHPIMGTEDE